MTTNKTRQHELIHEAMTNIYFEPEYQINQCNAHDFEAYYDLSKCYRFTFDGDRLYVSHYKVSVSGTKINEEFVDEFSAR